VQSINDLGLHHQFLARGVTTVKGALAVGEAYILASHMHWNRVASRQVDTKPSAAPAALNAETPAVANVTQITVASKVDQLTDMLAKLVAALVPSNQVDNTREPSGPRTQTQATLLLGMRKAWTFPEELSSTPSGVKLPRPADTPASCGPPVNSQGRTKWRPPRWAPLSNLTERPPTRQVGSFSHSSHAFSVPLHNRVDRPWSQRL